MSIRKVRKDHRPKVASTIDSASARVSLATAETTSEPFVFWIGDPERPTLLDLREFAIGRASAKDSAGGSKRWGGSYSGRENLLQELLPAIKVKLALAAPGTVGNLIKSLRQWWRLFDRIEDAAKSTNAAFVPMSSVTQLAHIHGEMGRQSLTKGSFVHFSSLAELTRRALGLPALAWTSPEQGLPAAVVPEIARAKPLLVAIKHGWFKALDRWSLVDRMLSGLHTAETDSEELLLANALFYRNTAATLERRDQLHPSPAQLTARFKEVEGASRVIMNRRGRGVMTMYSAFYPGPEEIRLAFHLALSGCGWNVSTMLDLKVDIDHAAKTRIPFLRDHPNNNPQEAAAGRGRYVLTGFKNRGASYHDVHGDWKSSRSPGAILRTVVERTWPLRVELIHLATLKRGEILACNSNESEHRDKLRQELVALEAACTSPWLYVTHHGVHALNADTYGNTGGGPWLDELRMTVNSTLPTHAHVPKIDASDFRDLYAAWVYETTGGNILAVRRALNHRRAATTARYLWTKILNHKATKRLLSFENALWEQIKADARIDATLLRNVMDQGQSSPIQIVRLQEYRELKKSRLGVGCKDPFSPPPVVDSRHKSGAPCATHRCSLCLHAHVGHDSMPGMAMRLAELLSLQSRMPVEHFSRDDDASFASELDNTRAILSLFELADVEAEVHLWTGRIDTGEHLVPEFSGSSRQSNSVIVQRVVAGPSTPLDGHGSHEDHAVR